MFALVVAIFREIGRRLSSADLLLLVEKRVFGSLLFDSEIGHCCFVLKFVIVVAAVVIIVIISSFFCCVRWPSRRIFFFSVMHRPTIFQAHTF